MKKILLRYLGFLILVLAIYIGHKYYLLPLYFEDQLEEFNFSYLFNAIASLMIIATLFLISFLDKDFIGFLLMLLGIIKILFFLILLKKYNFSLERKFFLNLFLPYAIGKIVEMFVAIEILRVNNSKNIK